MVDACSEAMDDWKPPRKINERNKDARQYVNYKYVYVDQKKDKRAP